jgi:hypothetical protein
MQGPRRRKRDWRHSLSFFLCFCLCVRLCPYFKEKRTRSHILCNFMSVLFLVLYYLHSLGPNVAEKNVFSSNDTNVHTNAKACNSFTTKQGSNQTRKHASLVPLLWLPLKRCLGTAFTSLSSLKLSQKKFCQFPTQSFSSSPQKIMSH